MTNSYQNARDAALALLSSQRFLSDSELRFLGEMSGSYVQLENWQILMISALLDREGLPPVDLRANRVNRLRALASTVARRTDLREKDRALAVACRESTAFAIENMDWLESFQPPVVSMLEGLL